MGKCIPHNIGMKNLQSLEDQVTSGLRPGSELAFEIGKSLGEIRDRKLYKESGYRSFAKYTEETFGITRARAYHLISAARVIEDLRSHFSESELPKNESVVRPLMKFQSKELIEVWRAVLETYSEPRRVDVSKIASQWLS